MKTIPYPHQPAAPTIRNRHELDAVIENIVQIQLNRAELEGHQEQEIAAIRQKYRTPLAELERYLTLETTWAETWARENPDAFNDKRSMVCTHATIGFRVTPPRVERASRKLNWSAIAEKLAEVPWGKRYLRVPPPEVNKEAVISDRAELDAEELRLAGLTIMQEERFFISPHRAPDSAHLSDEWQEAA